MKYNFKLIAIAVAVSALSSCAKHDILGEIVRGVSYENAKRYFHFAEKK